jgi:hypothetical protein
LPGVPLPERASDSSMREVQRASGDLIIVAWFRGALPAHSGPMTAIAAAREI